MKLKTINQINNLEAEDRAAYIVANDGQLATEIIRDWLGVTLPIWEAFYNQLSDKPKEGSYKGPTPPQEYVLRRMRDKGHRIAHMRGMLRWIGGSDRKIFRNTAQKLIEKGWVRIIPSSVLGFEYELMPTLEGMAALANAEMDEGSTYHK